MSPCNIDGSSNSPMEISLEISHENGPPELSYFYHSDVLETLRELSFFKVEGRLFVEGPEFFEGVTVFFKWAKVCQCQVSSTNILQCLMST